MKVVGAWVTAAVCTLLLLAGTGNEALATFTTAHVEAKTLVYDPAVNDFSALLQDELLKDPLRVAQANADPVTESDVDLLALLANMVLCFACLHIYGQQPSMRE